MALQFRLRDFCHPAAILRLRREFERTQWYSPAALESYQDQRLAAIVAAAYAAVPFYRQLFDRLRLRPGDVRAVADLKKLPLLTKAVVREQFAALRATAASRGLVTITTSGTTGAPTRVVMDGPANTLEFVHYWRHWNWVGYRLGDRFAEFSNVAFADKPRPGFGWRVQRLANRLLLDARRLSPATVAAHAARLTSFRPCIVKGLASVLAYVARIAGEHALELPRPKAVISTGEALGTDERRAIETAFGCAVYNSYGHVERTVAIAECPQRSLHVISDYGVLEPIGARDIQPAPGARPGAVVARVVGTGLFNRTMPLIRYDAGDLIEIVPGSRCACGRHFPVVDAIYGRATDVLIGADGSIITAMYLLFDDQPHIEEAHVIQRTPGDVCIRVRPSPSFTVRDEQALRRRVVARLGAAASVHIDVADADRPLEHAGKRRLIVRSVAGHARSAEGPLTEAGRP